MEHLIVTYSVKITIAIVFAVMIAAMGSLNIIKYFFHKDVENYLIRARSFLFIVIFFTLGFTSNMYIAFGAIMLISYLCLKEFLSLIPTRKTDRKVLLWAYLSIPVQAYFIYTHWVTMFYLFIPLYMFLIMAIRMVVAGNTDGFLKSLAVMQWGLMTTVYAIGYLGLILIIPFEYNPVAGGVGLLAFILIFTVLNDFMQMFCGKAFGKHKIIPKVSPNKTWEGFIGGVVFSTIISALMAPHLTPLTLKQSLFAGAALAIAGFFGDVTMSAVKRDMGVKDTSSLIPGHGGILDRLDSLIFTAPLFYHYVAYINTIVIPR